MKINKIFFLLLLLTYFENLFAQEDTYFLPGRAEYNDLETAKSDNNNFFLPSFTPSEDLIEKDEKNILYALPGSGKELDKDVLEDKGDSSIFIVNPSPPSDTKFSTGNLKDETVGQLPAGSKDLQTSEFEGMDNFSRLEKLRDKAKNQIRLSVLLDNYNYGGPPGLYDQLFDQPNSNFMNQFLFLASYTNTFVKSFFSLSWGLNAGFSYKKGTGKFENGSTSDTTIVLWVIPVDLPLVLQFPVGPIFNMEISAGPSLMTLLQNRSDRSEGESGQNVYQLSPGYFAGGSFKINSGKIFKDAGLAIFNSADVTNMFFNLDVRYESYNKFSDQSIKVDGVSFGIGLAFEFL